MVHYPKELKSPISDLTSLNFKTVFYEVNLASQSSHLEVPTFNPVMVVCLLCFYFYSDFPWPCCELDVQMQDGKPVSLIYVREL